MSSTAGIVISVAMYRIVALLPQEEVVVDGQQLEPGGLNAIVLPFADEVRDVKAPANTVQVDADHVKTEGNRGTRVAGVTAVN